MKNFDRFQEFPTSRKKKKKRLRLNNLRPANVYDLHLLACNASATWIIIKEKEVDALCFN